MINGGIAISCLVIFYILFRSKLGFCFAIYGENPNFFKHYNISSRFVVSSGIVLAHASAGLTGCLFALSNGFIDLTMNFGVVLLCLTALMLGSCFSSQNRPSLRSPLFGVFLYYFLQQGLLKIGFDLKYFNAIQAGVFILFLYFQTNTFHFSLRGSYETKN